MAPPKTRKRASSAPESTPVRTYSKKSSRAALAPLDANTVKNRASDKSSSKREREDEKTRQKTLEKFSAKDKKAKKKQKKQEAKTEVHSGGETFTVAAPPPPVVRRSQRHAKREPKVAHCAPPSPIKEGMFAKAKRSANFVKSPHPPPQPNRLPRPVFDETRFYNSSGSTPPMPSELADAVSQIQQSVGERGARIVSLERHESNMRVESQTLSNRLQMGINTLDNRLNSSMEVEEDQAALLFHNVNEQDGWIE